MFLNSDVPSDPENRAQHFKLEFHTTANYSDDPIPEFFNTSVSQLNVELYAGDAIGWIPFPAGGATLAYYGNKIRFALQNVVVGTDYYTRIRTLYNNIDEESSSEESSSSPSSSSSDDNWVELSSWEEGTYPENSLYFKKISAVAINKVFGGSNKNGAEYHKHSAVEYDGAGAVSGAVILNFARGGHQNISTKSGLPITSITMIESGAGDKMELQVDNSNATTVTPKTTELIGAGETGKYIIKLRNIGGTIMVDKTKTEIE